jgi:tripartite-type tricarboxylate transporter receptor subunit TctC
MRTRTISCLLALALVAAGPLTASAQTEKYPSRPIHWIVPYTPGSAVDVYARKFAVVIGRELGGTIVIENRPGASGLVGATEVAKSAPNGYTFLYAIADPLIAGAILVKDVQYDPFKDFTLITKVQVGSPVIILNPENKANSLKEFLDNAKSSQTTYASFGPGSFPQLVMEQLAIDSGAKLQEVAYRSPPQAIQETTTNQTSATLTSPPTARNFLNQGKAKVVATLGAKRLEAFPDVPTIQEATGYNSLILRNPVWSGLFAPAGLPPQIRQMTVDAVHRAIADPELVAWGKSLSIDLLKMTSEEFAAEFRAEYDAVSALIQKAGIKASDNLK